MPINTTFDPQNLNDFEKSKLIKDSIGISTIASPGLSTNLDYLLTDDSLIMGGSLLVKNAAQGDSVSFQILMGETVVNQFVTNWLINPDATLQETPTSSYPAKLQAGLTLRVIYHPTGIQDVWFAVNYNRDKILI